MSAMVSERPRVGEHSPISKTDGVYRGSLPSGNDLKMVMLKTDVSLFPRMQPFGSRYSFVWQHLHSAPSS